MNYEAWREALIAFYEAEGGHMPQTLESLRWGAALTEENKRIVRGIVAAVGTLQPAQARNLLEAA